jgi:hypothetical protein
LGEAQSANGAPSSLHSNDPVSLPENAKVAEVAVVEDWGAEASVVSGAVVSIAQEWETAGLKLPTASLARTLKECWPSPSP